MSPGLVAVLLDWAKAFDRIKHDALLQALRRFGIPGRMVDIIAGIYRERSFILQDPAGDSSVRRQRAGIAQGCPLSPCLFVIVQTVMFFDVDARMAGKHPTVQEPDFIPCADLLYADGTMLTSSCAAKFRPFSMRSSMRVSGTG